MEVNDVRWKKELGLNGYVLLIYVYNIALLYFPSETGKVYNFLLGNILTDPDDKALYWS